jgi:hypothetical protein
MPLPAPASRKPIHNRIIACHGYRREDGLWDIEGRLVDTKPFDFSDGSYPDVKAGVPLHEMLIRLTLDDHYLVVAIANATEHAPQRACGDILPNFQRLVGERVGRGWTKRVKELVGGAEGCAHHVEMLGTLSAVAFQTMGPLLAFERAAANPDGSLAEFNRSMLNSCHILREGGEWARQRNLQLDGTRKSRETPPAMEA